MRAKRPGGALTKGRNVQLLLKLHCNLQTVPSIPYIPDTCLHCLCSVLAYTVKTQSSSRPSAMLQSLHSENASEERPMICLVTSIITSRLPREAVPDPAGAFPTGIIPTCTILTCTIPTFQKFIDVEGRRSAVTILKSRSKIAIFCQNRPKSKSLHLLSHVSISSCVDFLQQLMDVTGLKDYNFRRFQAEYCVYTKHGLKIE